MRAEAGLDHIVKIASRCNLNCSYCYVYNKEDTSWRDRPSVMSRETYSALIERVRTHALLSGQDVVRLMFHGGEPTMVGTERFAWMCATAREQLGDVTHVELSMQTNGTRLSRTWTSVLRENEVNLGISLDGPKDVNDLNRVDHRGRGSHDAVARGAKLLAEEGIPLQILSVVQPGADPLITHHHFLELGSTSISYLLPAYTHDTVGSVREEFGPTPCADFLIPIFDDWWLNSTIDLSIREFWNLGRLIMGGSSQLDTIGNPPLRFVCTETDGSIQGLDMLRVCEDGLVEMGLNVHTDDFSQIADASPFHEAVLDGLPLPTGCRGCPEEVTCAGGHPPARYSQAAGFDNPSVWCADLLALFAHVRKRMGISHEETARRRAALRQAESRRLAAEPA